MALLLSLTFSLAAQVKMAYVNFVNHCYVDTEVEMKEIYTSNHIWTLFENFTLDIARVCPCGRQTAGQDCGLGGQPSRGWQWRGPYVGLPRHLAVLPQVCSKREKRLADPTLEKYVLTVVLDTISAFFSSPFSENSTSLQVGFSLPGSFCVGKGENQKICPSLLVVLKEIAKKIHECFIYAM